MKLPPQAKLIFKGQIFDVYQWEQELFDGSKAIFEMIKRPNTVQIIPTSDEKIFLLEEEQPTKGRYHSLIGGRQDERETPLECAKRELLEESGMVSDNWEMLFTYDPYSKIDWTIYVFVARNCKKIQEQNLDAGEKIQVQIATFDEFITMMIKSNIRVGSELILDIMRIKEKSGVKLDKFKKKLFGKK